MASPSSTRCTGAAPLARPCCTPSTFWSYDGEDLRGLPLSDRKKRLARLLGGRRLGIVPSDHTDDDGATIFRQARAMGLEGIVSKKLTAPYRSGPSRDWIKVKNPDSAAVIRAREGEW
jgi:bifunctional non-homologous end joining protein LigD